MNCQNGSTGHTGGGHFIHTYVLDNGHFTDIVSALAIQITVSPVISEKLMTGEIDKTRNLGFIS